MVPGFTVEQYRTALRALHEQIEAEGPFVAHSARFLIEARKPSRAQARRVRAMAQVSSRKPSRKCST